MRKMSKKDLRKFIYHKIIEISETTKEFEDDTDLLSEKILNSIGFINLIVELENLLGTEFVNEHMSIENFISVKAILSTCAAIDDN